MKKLHVLLFCLIPSFYFAQNKIQIKADYDAAIGYHDNYNTANNNYQNAIQNAAYVLPGNNGGLNVNRSLIHFDLTQIPKNIKINSIKLNLYALGNDGGVPGHKGSNNNAIISRVIEKWEVDKVTWNNQPKTTNKNHFEIDKSNSFDQDYLSLDVTNLFIDILDTVNFGVKIQLLNEDANNVGNALFFASLDNGNSNKLPWIEIEYFEYCNDITTTKDAAIGYHDNYNTASNNYYNAVQNAAYALPGNIGGLNVNRAVINFDLSSLPTDIEIISGKLDLYALGPISNLNGHTGSENQSFIERITSNWEEKSVTWNNQPTTTSENRVSLSNSTSETQDYLDIDVTNIYKDILSSNENNGIMLRLQNENIGNGLLFCSSDYENGSKAPKLTLCYKEKTDTSILLVTTLINNKEVITIFPNPTKESITIKNQKFDISNKYRLSVINQFGQILINENLNSEIEKISLINFSKGIYIVQVLENNELISSQKVIVQ